MSAVQIMSGALFSSSAQPGVAGTTQVAAQRISMDAKSRRIMIAAAAARLRANEPHLLAQAVAELGAARRPLLIGYVPAVEYVEILQDRVALAGHGKDAQELARR